MNPALAALAFLCTASILLEVQGHYDGFFCSKRSSSGMFPCAQDCMHQHGATGGACRDAERKKGNYNCYCGPSSGRAYPLSMQCRDRRNADFSKFCTMDCMCSHAAKGGHCDWDKKACRCDGQGENPKNVGCQAKTVMEYVAFSRRLLGANILNVPDTALSFVDDLLG